MTYRRPPEDEPPDTLRGVLVWVFGDSPPPRQWLARAHTSTPAERCDVYLVDSPEIGSELVPLAAGDLLACIDARVAFASATGPRGGWAPPEMLALVEGRLGDLVRGGTSLELHASLPLACDAVALECIDAERGLWRPLRAMPEVVLAAHVAAPFTE